MDGDARRRVIRHCALHTIISSVPSFVYAWLSGIRSASQVGGMIAGILFFMAGAIAVHLSSPMKWVLRNPLRADSVRLGKTIRLIQALVAVPFSFLSSFVPLFGYLMIPDIWAGIVAMTVTELLVGKRYYLAGFKLGVSDTSWFNLNQAAITFTATVIEGCVLASALGLLCLILWIILFGVRRIRGVPQSRLAG